MVCPDFIARDPGAGGENVRERLLRNCNPHRAQLGKRKLKKRCNREHKDESSNHFCPRTSVANWNAGTNRALVLLVGAGVRLRYGYKQYVRLAALTVHK